MTCVSNSQSHRVFRRGAVIPLVGLLLPVLVILALFAVNVAYMQLTRTELRIATDAAARAGGRAWSEFQRVNVAETFAIDAAAANTVANSPLVLTAETDDIEFGTSSRLSSGFGRYEFTKVERGAVEAGTVNATSIRINGNRTGATSISLLLGGVGRTTHFSPMMSAVCTQVDRDIAIVLDKSGSMSYYEDEDALAQELQSLRDDRTITRTEYNEAIQGYDGDAAGLYARYYAPNVIDNLPTAMAEYGEDMNVYTAGPGAGNGPAPRHSRWDILTEAVSSFIAVLNTTDQEEQLSLATFNSSATLNHNLVTNFALVQATVDGIIPYSGTSIGEGMQEGILALLAADARPYASKTIVVMTDGENNPGEISPTTVATNIVASHNVTIHTVTFTAGADQDAMEAVAAIGGGKAFHANESSELIAIFEQIANNLPTIITQ